LDNLIADLLTHTARTKRTVLIAKPNIEKYTPIVEFLGSVGIEAIVAKSKASAIKELNKKQIDCIIISPKWLEITATPDIYEEEPQGTTHHIPIIVYGAGNINQERWKRLIRNRLAYQTHSFERLCDLLTATTHLNIANIPEEPRKSLFNYYQSKPLAGKKVLIVDDDTRNIFALTSVLEDHCMIIYSADNGSDAIKMLQKEPHIDVVLMDIMMPEKDGMQTIREIRQYPELKDLPIVAVTAKAMKGDREKCLEAGAWDYLSKPVNSEQMMAVLRAWLIR
jgi:CheY-like chemotaxis protein